MMPHPTTMRFAWEEGVLRCSQIIISIFVLALAVLIGSALLTSGAQGISPAAAAEPEGQQASLSAVGTPPQMSPVEFVWQTKGGPDLPLDPINPAIDPDGNLWVPDGRNLRFQIFAPDLQEGAIRGEPGSAEGQFDFVDPAIAAGYGQAAAAFDGAGNLYVLDSGNRRVQKFGPDRRFLTPWGRKGEREGQFLAPIDLALDGQGRVYVTDWGRDGVQVFTADGGFLATWGTDAHDGITVAPDGNLWVTDWHAHRVQQYSSDGVLLATWDETGSGEGQFRNPSDVAVDGQGRVYVADFGNHRVQVFAGDGRFLTEWGQAGSEGGEFASPTSLVLDGQGNIYVAEESGDRVQKFRLPPPLAR